MSTLFTFCAISGAGKSTFAEQLALREHAKIISMDAWRKKLTGSISDQSMNTSVHKHAWDELNYTLGLGENAVWDATNLRIADIKSLLSLAKSWEDDMVVFVFDISAQPDVCRSRVQADLDKGVDRSNTAPGDIIQNQHTKWLNTSKLLSDLVDPALTVVHV